MTRFPPGRTAAVASGILFALFGSPGGEAAAEPPAAIHLVGTLHSCPSLEEVAAALAPVLPRTRVHVDDDAGSGAVPVTIFDLGMHYRVIAGTRERAFFDADHACGERARAAAVFIALALDPPAVMLPTPEAAPAAATPDGSAVTLRLRLHLDVEAAGLVVLAPPVGGTQTLVSGGGGVRLILGVGWLGLSLGVAGLAPAEISLGETGRVSLLRVPIDAGLRGALRRGRVELLGEVGAAFPVVVARGVGLASPAEPLQATRVEPGLRVAAGLRLWFHKRFAPFASAELVWSPLPSRFTIAPRGVLGSAPPLWLALAVGVAFSVF